MRWAGSGLTSLKGTPYWMAPEVVRGEKYGRKADIWSVGATVVEMLTGKHPWPATEHHFATFTQIATAKGGPPVPATISRELRDFLSLCFARWGSLSEVDSQAAFECFVGEDVCEPEQAGQGCQCALSLADMWEMLAWARLEGFPSIVGALIHGV